LSNNNPHWNLALWFLFFPDLTVKVLFGRQVYSNSSTGLENSVQGVWNTPPSPTFGTLFNPVKVLVGKEGFTLEKILP
jgi:hypothetical protein